MGEVLFVDGVGRFDFMSDHLDVDIFTKGRGWLENGAGGLKLIVLPAKVFTKARKTKIDLGLMSEHSTSKVIVLPVNIFMKRKYRLGYGVEGFDFGVDTVAGHGTDVTRC